MAEPAVAHESPLVAERPAKAREFFGGLESLRGLAALLVVLYHLPPWHPTLFEIPLIRHGHLMVNFFFVLSGFVLFHSYAKKLRTAVDLRRFVLLRLGRLYPIHLLFMAPFLLIELGKWWSASHGHAQLNAPTLGAIVETLTANLLLAQGLGFTDNAPAFNFPNWSISVEFYTYLVFAAVILLLPPRRVVAGCVVLAVLGIALPLLIGRPAADFSGSLACIGGFFSGCLTRVAYERLQGSAVPSAAPYFMAALCLILLCIPFPRHEYVPDALEQLSYPLSALLILSLLLVPSSRLNAWLELGPLRFLGTISYSLYMCHAIVQWIARQLARRLPHGPDRVLEGITAPSLSLGTTLLLYVVVTAITLALAALAYRLVEDPSRRAARRWVTGS